MCVCDLSFLNKKVFNRPLRSVNPNFIFFLSCQNNKSLLSYFYFILETGEAQKTNGS